MMRQNVDMNGGSLLKKVAVGVVIVLVLVAFVPQMFAIVPAGHRGVFMVWGAVDESQHIKQ